MLRRASRILLSAAKPRALVSVAPVETTFSPTQFLTMLRDKDAELKELRAAKDAELKAKGAELKAEREAKDAELKAKGAELKAEREAKDAELKAERAAKDAELKAEREAAGAELARGLKAEREAAGAKLDAVREAAGAKLDAVREAAGAKLDAERAAAGAKLEELRTDISALKSTARQVASDLAHEKYKADTARRIIGVRASLELCITDLWGVYGGGNKTRGTTDRLQMLTAGKVLCRPLVDYVKEAAAANGLNPDNALEQLPSLYRVLSAPMHQAGFADDVETPIEAIFNGDPLTLLLASCVYKMTRRDLRLYRMTGSGMHESVQFILEEAPAPPLA